MIASDIRHLVFDNKMMLCINCCLDVVADRSGSLSTAGHRARIRVSERQLPVRFILQLMLDLLKLTHPLAQERDLLVQAHGLHIKTSRTGPVCGFNHVEVSLDAFLDLLLAFVDFARSEVSVAAVHSLELAAVDGDHIAR
jgi:hypothetical protein